LTPPRTATLEAAKNPNDRKERGQNYLGNTASAISSGSRWEPFWGQLQQVQNELNHLFNRWGDGNFGPPASSFPAVNVWEEGDTVRLEVELPGMDMKDLEVYVTGGNQLTIKGERKQPTLDKGVWHRQERGYGNFVRVLTLPFPVDPEKVEAKFENGVLRVALAKHESAKPRKIKIKVD
jgi:HSP20 family protein